MVGWRLVFLLSIVYPLYSSTRPVESQAVCYTADE